MPKGLILLGPSGSGKTTLGKLVAGRLGIAFLDIDDYIWRTDTAIPYTVMYTKAEKIRRLMDAVEKAGEFVMAGSMNSFHEYFDPFFLLAVYLTAEEKLRVSRVHDRELAEDKIQKLTDKMIEKVDKAVEAKTKEIMTV